MSGIGEGAAGAGSGDGADTFAATGQGAATPDGARGEDRPHPGAAAPAAPPGPPAVVVFDFGGVVFRWRPLAVMHAALPARVRSDADAAHWAAQVFQGYGGDWGEFDRGRVDVAELAGRIAARTGLGADEVRAVVDAVAQELQPLPETVDLIARLHAAGVVLHYLSNMPGPTAAALQARHPALFARFAGGVFSSGAHANKPEPAIYDLARRGTGRAAGELLFIDDHPPNVAAAQALGWDAVVFADAATLEAQLHARGVAGARAPQPAAGSPSPAGPDPDPGPDAAPSPARR